MTLKDRLALAIRADGSPANMSLSPAEAAMNFAASFHRDAKACRTAREQEQLHEIYRDKILAIDNIAANIAAAFLPLLRATPSSRSADAERWGDFDRLADRGKNMRDRESQHLQHQSSIIAAWGPECFQYYGWHTQPLPLLRQLHDLAVLMPQWDDVVDLLNSKMLARHELRVLHGRNRALRIGEHSAASKVQDSRSPVERSDILAALEWARQKATSAVARQQIKQSAQGINGTPIKHFGLKRDLYGMVVPSVGPDSSISSPDKEVDEDHNLSTRSAKRTKLSTGEHRRLLFSGSSSSRRSQASRTQTRNSENASTNSPSSSGLLSEEPEAGVESQRLARMKHVQHEYVDNEPEMVETQMMAVDEEEDEEDEEDEEGEEGEEEEGEEEATTRFQASTVSKEAKNNEDHDVESSDEERDNETGSQLYERNGEQEAGNVESEEPEETIDEREEMAAETTSSRPSNQDTMEQDRDSNTFDIQRNGFGHEAYLESTTATETEEEIQKDGMQTDEAQVCEHRHERERLDTTENKGSGGNKDRENVEVIAGSLEGVLNTEQSDMHPHRTPGLESVHERIQQASTSISDASASRATSPLIEFTAASSCQTTNHRIPTVPVGDDFNKHIMVADETLHPNVSDLTQMRSSIADSSGLPSQPPALLDRLRERYDAQIRRLIEDLSRPHTLPEVEHQRRLQLDWLAPQRWASIYAEPEHQFGRNSVESSDNADVWYLSWDSFRRYADSGYIFRRPIVIKQTFQDSGMYDIAEYLDMLWQRFPEQRIDVQNSMTGACTLMSMKEYCLTVTKVDLCSPDATASVSNAVNLRRLARADEPLLSRMPRFRLLSTLADRVAGNIGKSEPITSNDVQSCLGFDLLGFAGSFSSPHVDSLAGSWVRCLTGVKIWAIAADLDSEDWRRFSNEGRHWSPQGKGRLIVLEQDDVLLMPPGLRVVQACFTPEPCLMEGGMVWDECAIPNILEELLWSVKTQGCTKESESFQLSTVIDALEQWFDANNHVHPSSNLAKTAEHRQVIKSGIQSLRTML